MVALLCYYDSVSPIFRLLLFSIYLQEVTIRSVLAMNEFPRLVTATNLDTLIGMGKRYSILEKLPFRVGSGARCR
ncbi:MAG: hypothetical protein D6681_09645 [Calditrichaeota bacterium]|nr:MAG: hypothetical protein D6681_09645 [Calditrichota bacterium]